MNLFEVFEQAGQSIYLVGGCVRDKILGVEPKDVDFATSAHPEETMDILAQAGLKAIPIGIEFGTVQTILDGEKVEITTFRCAESYTKGSRKPGVVFGQTVEEDLARRDFTFNAIAMDKDGNFIDPFSGKEDLGNGEIRTPIDPNISFSDDPLRMMRACRFVARGLGEISSGTKTAIKKNASLVSEVSAERICEEMDKLLTSPHPAKGMEALAETHILSVIFPELQTVKDFREDQGKFHHLPVWEHTMEVLANSHNSSTVRWAALFHDVSKPQTWSRKKGDVHFYGHDQLGATVWESIADRLKTSREFKEHVSQLIFEHQNVRGDMGKRGVRRLVNRLGDRLQDLFFLREADIIGHKPSHMKSSLEDLNQLVRRANAVLDEGTVNAKLPRGTGDKVAEALGIKPGPELGKVMRQLQQQLTDGELTPESDFVEAAKKVATYT